MVGTVLAVDYGPDVATAKFVQDRLAGQTHRFMTVTPTGGLRVHLADLAELVTEIVTEFTDHVVAERDALAEDLAHELNARGGVQHADLQVSGVLAGGA